eukprot:m.83558 g.83558  ORF g.83558 m.83558 type:complete len:847 (-) comp8693_c0_seq1:22-2562(-)
MVDVEVDYDKLCAEGGEFGLDQARAVVASFGWNDMSEEQLNSLLHKLDIDGDGIVSKQDFCEAMKAYSKPKTTLCDWEHEDDGIDFSNVLDAKELDTLIHQLTLSQKLSSNVANQLSTALKEALHRQAQTFESDREDFESQLSQLEQRNNQLSADLHRVDTELAEVLEGKSEFDAMAQENSKLSQLVSKLGEQLERKDDELSMLTAQTEETQVKFEVVSKQWQRSEEQLESLKSDFQLLAQDKSIGDLKERQLQRERDEAVRSSCNAQETISSLEQEVLNMRQELMTMSKDLTASQARLHEMEEALEMKESTNKDLNEEALELRDLVASLRSGSMEDDGQTGSLLNEIEDIVKNQFEAESAGVEENKRMTISLLQRLLPRLEETRLDPTPTTFKFLQEGEDEEGSESENENGDDVSHETEDDDEDEISHEAEAIDKGKDVKVATKASENEHEMEVVENMAELTSNEATTRRELVQKIEGVKPFVFPKEDDDDSNFWKGFISDEEEDDDDETINYKLRMDNGKEEVRSACMTPVLSRCGSVSSDNMQRDFTKCVKYDEDSDDELMRPDRDVEELPIDSTSTKGEHDVSLEKSADVDDSNCDLDVNNSGDEDEDILNLIDDQELEDMETVLQVEENNDVNENVGKRQEDLNKPASSPQPMVKSEALLISSSSSEVDRKVDQMLRLYAASTQHIAGMKIVTEEIARGMDTMQLQNTIDTMKGLVSAKNKMLLKVLDERDVLHTEIQIKKMAVKPLLTMMLAQANSVANGNSTTALFASKVVKNKTLTPLSSSQLATATTPASHARDIFVQKPSKSRTTKAKSSSASEGGGFFGSLFQMKKKKSGTEPTV